MKARKDQPLSTYVSQRYMLDKTGHVDLDSVSRVTLCTWANAAAKQYGLQQYLEGGKGPAIVYLRKEVDAAALKIMKPLTAAA